MEPRRWRPSQRGVARQRSAGLLEPVAQALQRGLHPGAQLRGVPVDPAQQGGGEEPGEQGYGPVGLRDSVTRVPSPSGTSSKRQRVPLSRVSKAKARSVSASTTVLVVLQRTQPRRLRPLNRAPTSGPAAPSSHSPPMHSGLSDPRPAGSLITAHTADGGAAMRRVT